MILSLIAAVDEDNVIGLGNTIPWDIPADLKYFQQKTTGHPVIMGRKTFDSIVEKIGHPLPNRRNIVITRKGSLHAGEYDQVASFEDAVDLARRAVDDPSFVGKAHEETTPEQGEAFVIGGQQIYEIAMERADRIYLTRIHSHFDGDKFFPHIPDHEWKVVNEDRWEADQDNRFPYTFYTYERRKE